MRAAIVIGLLSACGFSGHATDDDAVDAPTSTDAPPAKPLCTPNDAYQKLCFSFDQPVFADPLPNEGSVAVAASLGGVTHDRVDGRDVARIGADHGMAITDASQITGILSTEIVFRADRLPTPAEERFALFDNGDHISAFLYNIGGQPQLRCELEAIWYSKLAPAANQWTYLACVCDAGRKLMYIDGAVVDTVDDPDHVGEACQAGVDAQEGVTLGQDNDGDTHTGDDALVGVIDHVRWWSSKLFPATVCQHAGAGC